MRASRARWALVTLSMLGLTGCQSGKSWWPSRSKMPPYSSSSTTPPAGVSQNQLPSAQASPYGEAQQDPSQYAQQASGFAGNPADPYGANNYTASGGTDSYGNPAAGAMPQNGPYSPDGYQQPAGGTGGYGGNGYGGAAGGNYAGGQMTNPYVANAAGGPAYPDYQAQQQGGYPAQQPGAGDYNGAGYPGGAAADPAGAGIPHTADARSSYGQPQPDYNAGSQYGAGSGAGYGGNGAMPEQTPYGQAGDAAWSQGASVPGNTDYQPGATGYNPPGAPPYQSPGANYNPEPNAGGSEPQYRPGGTSNYVPGGTAGAAGGGAAGYDNSGYGNQGAASPSRYPNSASASGYPSSGSEDRYGRPTTAGAAGGANGGYFPPQR